MKITKFAHSCVLIEHIDKAVLIDPGIFSWQSNLVDCEKLPPLNAIVVTHRHGDHLGEPFVYALVEAQPEVQWIAPADAHEQLKNFGVRKVTDQSTEDLQVTTIEHAKVDPFGEPCQNLVVHCFGLVSDPGDSHDLQESKDVLLLPVQAPWGTTVHAFELGLALKPKYIVPIHDWMWNNDWRTHVYNRLDAVFEKTNTQIIRPENGHVIDIDL